MSIKEKISNSFSQLIKEAQRPGDRRGSGEYLRFRSQAMNLIRRACGADSDHYQELKIADLQLKNNKRIGGYAAY